MRVVNDLRMLEVRMLGVDPAMQRQGVARMLIAGAAERAMSRDLEALALQSDEDLTSAHALYRRLGFRRRPDLDVSVDEQYRAFGYELALDQATA